MTNVSALLLIVTVLRGVVEVALLALLGQWVVGLLSGVARESNYIYCFFRVITQPPIRVMRFFVPRQIVDKHIAVVSFFVLLWLWILLAYVKRSIVG